jgi:hypothetical protein
MVHPQVVVGGYGLITWRIVASILNKQSQQPVRTGPPGWEVDRGANNSLLLKKSSLL